MSATGNQFGLTEPAVQIPSLWIGVQSVTLSALDK